MVHCAEVVFNRTAPAVSTVILGGDERHEVKFQGDVILDGGPLGPVKITGVLYVPTLVLNLCSGVQLTNKGAVCVQQGNEVTIQTPKGDNFLIGHKSHGLYRLSCQMRPYVATVNSVSATAWHRRLGHPGIDALKVMSTSDSVLGLDNITLSDYESCDVCVSAKQTRQTYPRSKSRAKQPLELVHSDLMFLPREGLQGEKYVLTLLDDYSRYCEVVCLHRKSDVPAQLIQVIVRWQRQSGHKLKCFRSDQGSEYAGFEKYLKAEGVVHQYSAVRTPQQNGRAERLNRTLIERTRALLFQHNCPAVLWTEAILTAVFTYNCLPSQDCSKTPHELFLGVKPDVSGLRIFGCHATVHTHATKRDKLAKVSQAGMHIGSVPHSKAWKVLVSAGLESWTIKKSADVRFDEDRAGTLPVKLRSASQDRDVMWDADWQEHPVTLIHDDIDDAEAIATQDEDGNVGNGEDGGEGNAGDVANSVNGEEDFTEAYSRDEHVAQVPDQVTGDTEVQPDEDTPTHKYPRRQRAPSMRSLEAMQARLGATQVPNLSDNPQTHAEAMARPDADLWQQAIEEELAALSQKSVFIEEQPPAGVQPIPAKLVLNIKRDQKGEIEKYKARLVAKGFYQAEGVDYDEIFAPTADRVTLRVLLSIASTMRLIIDQIDVRTAFLNGDLVEQVYLRLPSELGGKVWRLQKALYGLKQAARAWHDKLRTEMKKYGFQCSEHEPCLFIYTNNGEHTFVMVHVDDALIVGPRHGVDEAKALIAQMFDTKDIGTASYFLGLEIERTNDSEYHLSQKRYTQDLLRSFEMNDCKVKTTPFPFGDRLSKQDSTPLSKNNRYAELIGSLLYLSVNTRPDIAYPVGVLSRFMSCPTQRHWEAGKRVLRYLQGTAGKALCFRSADGSHKEVVQRMHAMKADLYTDADFASDIDQRRSTSGVVLMLNGTAVLWGSKMQKIVATSTTEAEYIAAAMGIKEALWVRKLLAELCGSIPPVCLNVDNQAALALIRQPTAGKSGRTKHIDVQYHFIRERYQRGDVQVKFVPTDKQLADMFTKQLPGPAYTEQVSLVAGGGAV